MLDKIRDALSSNCAKFAYAGAIGVGVGYAAELTKTTACARYTIVPLAGFAGKILPAAVTTFLSGSVLCTSLSVGLVFMAALGLYKIYKHFFPTAPTSPSGSGAASAESNVVSLKTSEAPAVDTTAQSSRDAEPVAKTAETASAATISPTPSCSTAADTNRIG